VRISAEALVILVALVFYLYDSLMLLAVNEAVLELGLDGFWNPAFGSNRWKIGGKEPYVPNPFLPHLQTYRLKWRMSVSDGEQLTSEPLHPPPELVRLVPFVYLSGICMFMLVPIGLFINVGAYFLPSAIALMYLNNLAALVVLWRIRTAVSLPSAEFYSVAFECVACPPFAVNLIRKLSRRIVCGEDFMSASKRLLQDEQLTRVNSDCLLRVDEQIDFAPEDSATMEELKALRINMQPDDIK